MAQEYSIKVCRRLEEKIRREKVCRPMRVERYDAGAELCFDVTGVAAGNRAKVRVEIEKFVGGGFAGQVYKVNVIDVEPEAARISGLVVGGSYAMKILIPPSGFSLLFRNLVYWIGFQSPFQLQVNPAASRAGALWQKFIRRGAKVRFGRDDAVVDILATFVDGTLGSCGEISEWVEGRSWRLEVDDRVDLLKRWRRKKTVDLEKVGSPEYRAKYEFMHDFVKLLHDMGGHEFARQYEWSTCKSQPNCLKRNNAGDDAAAGLTAVDFRAGLALLPFLPMSPGDFKLIFNGLCRGSLVQFDRGNIKKLEGFIEAGGDEFADMGGQLEELKASEEIYRNSQPDVTHNHLRLLYSGKLWSMMLGSAITGWKVRGLVDGEHEAKFRKSRLSTILFFVLGLLPILGPVFRKAWGRADWRSHYVRILTGGGYLVRAVRVKMAEKVIGWHRAGRVDEVMAEKVAGSFSRFMVHLPLSILPIGLHRFLTDIKFAKEKLAYLFVRPVRLYFNAGLREEWLREMVSEGRKKHILTDEDAETILSQVNEPFIQKYLVSLVVHLLTLPVTQIVSVACAGIYVYMHPEMPRAQAWAVGIGIIAMFQVIPVSPGSICRGLYTVYMAIKDRSFRDYNIALFLSFFKYIGYLAFPIQMTYHYPVLARFMAGHWATEAVHLVPVFGEHGALLEHWVYCLFYNWPLTIRRRMRKRAEVRAEQKARYWHVAVCAIVLAAIFGIIEFVHVTESEKIPGLRDIWLFSALLPLICGGIITLGCGGAALWKRVVGGAVGGVFGGVIYSAITVFLTSEAAMPAGQIATMCVWRIFVFSVLATIGVVLTELKLPEAGGN